MSASARRWLTWGAAGLVAGLALGLFIGWWLWPLRFADASPAYLRTDYRDDYVLMIAQAYQVDGDLHAARVRLLSIDPEEPARPLRELSESLLGAGGNAQDAEQFMDLAAALGSPPDSLSESEGSP